MDSDLPLEFGPPRGVNAVTRRLADVSRAAELLGWKAEMGLDEGLRQLVTWWREQRRAGAEEASDAWHELPVRRCGSGRSA